MATYTKETALYDTGAIADDIQEAGAQVNKYITRVGDDGIKVHPYNTTTGEPDETNYSKIDSDGMTIYKDERQVATFGENTVIGKPYDSEASDNESHIEMDYHSLRLVDKEGNAYVHFSDLRDKTGSVTVTSTQISDGEKTQYILSGSSVVSVKVNGEDIAYTASITPIQDPTMEDLITVTLTGGAQPADAEIEFTYTRTKIYNKAYTLGIRGDGAIGSMSHAEGYGTVASGYLSYASGHDSVASGYFSHAEGSASVASGYCSYAFGDNVRARYDNQMAIGKFNSNSKDNLFEIGNGASDLFPKTIFSVSNSGEVFGGDINSYGDITVQNHSSPIGTVVSVNPTSTTNIASGRWGAVAHIDLTPGVWLAICSVRFPKNATGYRKANLNTASGNSSNQICVQAANGDVTQLQFTRVVTPSNSWGDPTRYYLNASHNAGTTLTMPASTGDQASTYIYAVRIQ